MNDRATHFPDPPAGPLPAGQPELALPKGMRLGTFEIQRVISRGANAIVYLAADDALAMPVAIQEYLPARLMRRDAGLRLVACAAWHDDMIARGLQAFVDEARMLARAEHPSLVRVHQLFHANGSAYRVMPVYAGQRLSDLRRQMASAPDETALRALLDGLLGALETIHETGQVHGGVAPENILLLADDRPLLLGAGAAARAIGSDLVESLMATLESPANAERSAEAGTAPTGPSRDLYQLASVIRFCITAEAPGSPDAPRQREPLADALARSLPLGARPPYGTALLDTLDAALSPFAQDRPLNAAQFRDWLARGVPAVPGGAIRAARVAAGAGAAVTATAAPPPEPPAAVAAPPAPAAASPAPVAAAPAPAPEPAFSFSDETEPRFDAPIAPWPDVVRATDPPFSHAPSPTAPPLPPPLQHATRTRQRHYKWLLGSGLAVLAAAVLAIATGAWNLAPELTLGPDAQRISVPSPRAALETVPRSVPETVPVPVPVPRVAQDAAAPTLPEAASRAVPEPAPAAPPAPIATELASETARPDASNAPPAIDPARTLATNPPSAGPAPRAPATRATAVSPAANSGSPRAACAGRTEFALYRCMVQQCQSKRWAVHPQCVRLRLDDRVD